MDHVHAGSGLALAPDPDHVAVDLARERGIAFAGGDAAAVGAGGRAGAVRGLVSTAGSSFAALEWLVADGPAYGPISDAIARPGFAASSSSASSARF